MKDSSKYYLFAGKGFCPYLIPKLEQRVLEQPVNTAKQVGEIKTLLSVATEYRNIARRTGADSLCKHYKAVKLYLHLSDSAHGNLMAFPYFFFRK